MRPVGCSRSQQGRQQCTGEWRERSGTCELQDESKTVKYRRGSWRKLGHGGCSPGPVPTSLPQKPGGGLRAGVPLQPAASGAEGRHPTLASRSRPMSAVFPVLLTIQLVVCVAMIGVILLQRSEGGGLGLGTGGGVGGLMTGRGTANVLTRTTVVLATIFIATSIALALVAKASRSGGPLTPGTDGPLTTLPGSPMAPVQPSPTPQPANPPATPVPAAPASPAPAGGQPAPATPPAQPSGGSQ